MTHVFRAAGKAATLTLICLLATPLRAQDRSDLLVSFEFKGSLLGYDLGVWSELYPKLDESKIGEVIVTGSSSGSVLTAYFACHGFNEASIRGAQNLLPAFDPKTIGEDDPLKFVKIATGIDPAKHISVLSQSIHLATDQGRCLPERPFAIVASNDEILRDTIPGTMRPANRKNVQFENNSVIDLASGETLGKACTYFTNEAGAKYLLKVPANRRLCDVRLVQSPADLVLAVQASVAEPTYFQAIPEPRPESFLEIAPPDGRRYQGGMPLAAIVQDFKIAHPEIIAVGTGGAYFPRSINRWLENLYHININQRTLETNWWYDFKVDAGHDAWASIKRSESNAKQLIELGRKTFTTCFQANSCKPTLEKEPTGSTAGLNQEDLRPFTKRGLRQILKSDQ